MSDLLDLLRFMEYMSRLLELSFVLSTCFVSIENSTEARFSLSYCLAISLLNGKFELNSLNINKNKKSLNLIKKIKLETYRVPKNFEDYNPKYPDIITVFLKDKSIFKEKVLEMRKAIKDAISVETFKDVEHLGGAAAAVIANNEWFEGRRHANQAFQVYEIWKGENQSPSFLSFRDENSKERFIILSGPHRPRYLKSNKSD